MQQFEEQMSAAKVVTEATRPLNLYYGLVQAGLAITAAHTTDQWSFNSHGLKLYDTDRSIGQILVKPEGSGAFQKVAAAINSQVIAGPVTVGAVWATIPDFCNVTPLDPAYPPTLAMFADTRPVQNVSRNSLAENQL